MEKLQLKEVPFLRNTYKKGGDYESYGEKSRTVRSVGSESVGSYDVSFVLEICRGKRTELLLKASN